jgi:hypothetical protein
VSDFGSQMGADGISGGPYASQQPAEQEHGRTRCQPGALTQRVLPPGFATQPPVLIALQG